MKTGIGGALLLSLIMAAVIFFCRAFPFLFFRDKKIDENQNQNIQKENKFLSFIEKTVPPVVMTVLAFNSISVPFKENFREGMLVLTASVFTALIHLLRRSLLISIFTGTAAYIVLERFFLS